MSEKLKSILKANMGMELIKVSSREEKLLGMECGKVIMGAILVLDTGMKTKNMATASLSMQLAGMRANLVMGQKTAIKLFTFIQGFLEGLKIAAERTALECCLYWSKHLRKHGLAMENYDDIYKRE